MEERITTTDLREAGIDVFTPVGFELGGGHGGSHCLSCPIERAAAF